MYNSETKQIWEVISRRPDTLDHLCFQIGSLGIKNVRLKILSLVKRKQIKSNLFGIDGITVYSAVGPCYMSPIQFNNWLHQESKGKNMLTNNNPNKQPEATSIPKENKEEILTFKIHGDDLKMFKSLQFSIQQQLGFIPTNEQMLSHILHLVRNQSQSVPFQTIARNGFFTGQDNSNNPAAFPQPNRWANPMFDATKNPNFPPAK